MGERQFGPYRLVRQIAVGGMAEIHLAKTRGIAGFEKFVALKMIHPNFAQDEQFIQMLIDEAKIAVQLQHVNIAQTFDLGRVGDTYYITMEYVDGADLYKILRRSSEQDVDMPLDLCAYVAKDIATGLDYAHRKRDVTGNPLGIVHRDVSPQNVLISYAGEVKLVDFGIAKATMRARQTQVGVIKGKYYYMSPEQAWGDPLDHRSDIFSCGIVLYEMLTGQMLYLEEDLHTLLDMVRRADIAPPSTLRRDVPPQLERIVMHALAKRPEDRYQSAADLATDLERFLHVYSPVFTASKLTAHLRKVVGDPVPIAEPAAAAAPRNPAIATQPLDRAALVSERSEITDENSVIFRVAELRAKDEAQRRPPTARPAGRPARGDDESTAAELPRGQRRGATGADLRPPPEIPPLAPPPRGRPPTNVPVNRGRPDAPAGAPPRPPTQPPARTKAPTAPQVPTRVPANIPTVVPGPTRKDVRAVLPASTMTLDAADLGEVEDMTAVTAPPRMPPAASTQPSGGLDYGDYEPTVIDGVQAPPSAGADHDAEPLDPADVDDNPTITRDGAGVPLPQPVSLSTSETAPRPHAELRSKIRPGAPAHPALAASTPTPAVSELRRPRGSRRTPPTGIPAGGSVLQAIVGAAPSDPMPTVPIRGGQAAPATSDGVPRALPDGGSSSAMTSPPPIPGQHALPVAYGPPGQIPGVPPPGQAPPYPPGAPHGQPMMPLYAPPSGPAAAGAPPGAMPLTAPPTPAPGGAPSQLPPHLVPYGPPGAAYEHLPPAAQVVAPGYPGYPQPGAPGGYPFGGGPMSFTKQMQAALDVDDIPQRFKLQEQRSRKLVWAVVLVLLFAGGIGLAVLLSRPSDAPRTAQLVIESMPSGASVVVDGTPLTETTPARFPTQPGARHEVEVTLPRHKAWKQAVVVPSSGGDFRVAAVLEATRVKLRINSQPGGAEIWINGELRGVTPKVLEGLDPETVTQVELRLGDFAPETRPLDWTQGDTIDVEVKFRK